MSYTYLNSEALQLREAIPFPATGGLDLTTDKINAHPGSLQDCLNYEISKESGYKLTDGLLRYSGRSYNTVKRWLTGGGYDPGHTWMLFCYSGADSSDPDAVQVWKRNNETWTQTSSIGFAELGGTQLNHLNLSPDQSKLAISGGGGLDDNIVLFNFDNKTGSLTSLSSDDSYSTGYSADWIDDSTIIQTVGTGGSTNLALYTLDAAGALTVADSIDVTGGGHNGASVAINPAGDRALVTMRTAAAKNVALVDFSGDTLTVLDTLDLPDRPWDGQGVAWSPDGTLGAVSCDSDRNIHLISISNDTLTLEDTIAGSGSGGGEDLSFDKTGNFLLTASSVYSVDFGNTLTYLRENFDNGVQAFSIDTEGVYQASGNANSLDPFVYIASFNDDTGTTTELQTIDLPANATDVRSIIFSNDIGRLYIGGEYEYESASGSNSGEIKILTLDSDTGNVSFQVISGDVPDGDIYVYLDRDSEAEYALLTSTALDTYTDISNYISKFFTNNKDIATDSFKPPGSGPITALFELDDKVYAVRDVADGSSGALYRTTNLTDLSKNVEWEQVDMGHSLDYDGGKNRFITVNDQEFLDENVSPQPPVTDALGSIAETYHTVESASYTNGSARATPWEDRSNVYSDGDAATTAQVGVTTKDSWNHLSQRLKVTGFDIGEGISDPVSVVGIEVEINAKYRSYLTKYSDLDVRMKTAQLTGVGGSDNKADTTIYTMTGSDTTADITYTLGGALDTWNMTDASLDNIFGEGFGIELDFEARPRGTANTGSTTSQALFSISNIKFTVYFDNSTERVYFWDGTTDVAEADVVGYSVVEGSFDNNNAKGSVTLYDITNPNNIVADLEIRSDQNGGGVHYADTDGELTGGSFPSWSEMKAEESLTQTIKTNFYIDEDKEAVYGVTGAGPAFVFDGTYLQTVRAPIDINKDKPRHIAEHQKHLVLGYKSGSILVSVAGEPTLFAGVQGASEWGFGDKVTGLLKLQGNALGIFCENSTHALMGTSIDNFTQQTISKSSGAIEYSVVDIGQPVYCDFWGIGNLTATEKYGDFAPGRTSYMVTSWLQPRLQEYFDYSPSLGRIKTAVPTRNKNQYKIFFNDGYILTMTLFGPAGDTPMFTIQNYAYQGDLSALPDRSYVPSASLSTVLSNGQELNMIGTEDGHIYIMDQPAGILTNSENISYDAFLVFNPFNAGSPLLNLKYSEAFVHLKHIGHTELIGSAGVNYLQPISNPSSDTINIGDLGNDVNLSQVFDTGTFHLPSVTAGYSLRIDSDSSGVIPHTIQSITYRVAPTSMRNYAPEGGQ